MRQIDTFFPPPKRNTPRVKQCLILAAGNGRRLIESSGGAPKPLVQLHGKSLLEHVILGAREAGIERFIIVVGYGADAMRRWLADRWLGNVAVAVVENHEYHKDNGISVLKARDLLREPFLLLMADHIFEPRTARALLEEPLKNGEVILAVDPKLDLVFDLDDATKVRREGDRIVDIGKTIPRVRCLRHRYVLMQPSLIRHSRIGKEGGKLLVVGRHADTGSRWQATRLRHRRGYLARCRYTTGIGLRRKYL